MTLGVALLALAAGVAYISSCAYRNAGAAQMPSTQELVWTFQSNYGRLCALTALALKAGHSNEHVVEAARGKGAQPAPVYGKLRAQYAVTYHALSVARYHKVPMDTLAKAARVSREACVEEWMADIPMFSEAA